MELNPVGSHALEISGVRSKAVLFGLALVACDVSPDVMFQLPSEVRLGGILSIITRNIFNASNILLAAKISFGGNVFR